MKNSPFRQFVVAYMECALWAPVNDTAPESHDVSDLAPEARLAMIRDCRDFYRGQSILLRDTIERSNAAWELHGHDFWLTRNRCGAGFWDRGYGSAGEALSAAARVCGRRDLYVGDDGKVYQS